ncbi:hypothetical protein IJI31_03915 [bacterium]|nr:hypothetical protein [bacterium]
MIVQKVNSFNGFNAKLKQTSKGNFYTETTTGKTAGTVLGLTGAGLLASSEKVQDVSKNFVSKIAKNPKLNPGWAAAGIIIAGASLIVVLGRKLGNAMDNSVNFGRLHKADFVA